MEKEMEGNCEKRITALISTIVHKLARSKCCRAVGNPLISAIQERNKREKERERGIDRVVKDGRKKMTEGGSRGGEGIKRRKSRYVSSRYVFIRRVKLSRGFYVFIYLSLSLSTLLTTRHEHVSGRQCVCLCTRLVDRVRALPIGSRVLL